MAENNELHAQVFELLMDKVTADPFPSVTMLRMLEGILRESDIEAYTSMLMDKVRQDQFPSMDHLRRLLSFV